MGHEFVVIKKVQSLSFSMIIQTQLGGWNETRNLYSGVTIANHSQEKAP